MLNAPISGDESRRAPVRLRRPGAHPGHRTWISPRPKSCPSSSRSTTPVSTRRVLYDWDKDRCPTRRRRSREVPQQDEPAGRERGQPAAAPDLAKFPGPGRHYRPAGQLRRGSARLSIKISDKVGQGPDARRELYGQGIVNCRQSWTAPDSARGRPSAQIYGLSWSPDPPGVDLEPPGSEWVPSSPRSPSAAERITELATITTGQIVGQLHDEAGSPIEGVVISALGSAFAVSDKLGQFLAAPAAPRSLSRPRPPRRLSDGARHHHRRARRRARPRR